MKGHVEVELHLVWGRWSRRRLGVQPMRGTRAAGVRHEGSGSRGGTSRVPRSYSVLEPTGADLADTEGSGCESKKSSLGAGAL